MIEKQAQMVQAQMEQAQRKQAQTVQRAEEERAQRGSSRCGRDSPARRLPGPPQRPRPTGLLINLHDCSRIEAGEIVRRVIRQARNTRVVRYVTFIPEQGLRSWDGIAVLRPDALRIAREEGLHAWEHEGNQGRVIVSMF